MFRNTIKSVMALAMVNIIAVSCSDTKVNAPDNSVQSDPPKVDQGKIELSCTIVPIPILSDASSRAVVVLDGIENPCSIEGYVVGFKNILKIQPSGNNSYFIDKIPAGKHDIVILERSGLGMLDNVAKHGLRIEKTEFLNGLESDLGKVKLQETSTLTGMVLLKGATDLSGVDVFIPGTEFSTKTDTNGIFSITGIPSGVQNIFVEKDGYYKGRLEEMEILPGTTKDLQVIELAIDTGAEGSLQIASGDLVTNSRAVRYSISTGKEAVLMKLSEDLNFQGSSWKPISTTGIYTFKTPGAKTLYAKVANANGLESSAFSATIVVDLFPASQGGLTINGGDSSSSSFDVNLGIEIPKNATFLMLSESNSFSGGDWVKAISRGTFNFNSEGLKLLYLKFKDNDGFESGTYSSMITVELFPTNSINFQLPTSTILRNPNTSIVISNIVYPSNATAMKIAKNSNFTNVDWISLSNSYSLQFSGDISNCGSHTIYMKFRSSEGVESRSISKGTILDCTSVFSANAPAGGEGKIVWTGSRILVWTGSSTEGRTYNPTNGSWSNISSVGAPSNRTGFDAIWTGSKMIVWGGADTNTYILEGGLYDPVADTWETIASTGLPTGESGHADWGKPHFFPIFVGGKLLIWGWSTNGWLRHAEGYKYDFGSSTWSPISSTNSPNTSGVGGFIVAAGTKLLLWEGVGTGNTTPNHVGGVYDTTNDTWTSLNMTGAPNINSLGSGSLAAYSSTYNKILIFGGRNDYDLPVNKGYLYDVSNNSWSEASSSGLPNSMRFDGYTVKTIVVNDKALIWSGIVTFSGSDSFSERAYIYDFSTDSWSTANSQTPRSAYTVTGVDNKAYVWGGYYNQTNSIQIKLSCFSIFSFDSGTWSTDR